jgi:hypothetical protein
MSGWHRRRKLAHAFPREHICNRRLELAQLLGQLGRLPHSRRARRGTAARSHGRGAARPVRWRRGAPRGSSAARAGNRRSRLLSALRTHTKVPYKIDLHRKTLRALNRPRAARTVRWCSIWCASETCLGFGRIAASDIEAPSMLVNMVGSRSGRRCKAAMRPSPLGTPPLFQPAAAFVVHGVRHLRAAAAAASIAGQPRAAPQRDQKGWGGQTPPIRGPVPPPPPPPFQPNDGGFSPKCAPRSPHLGRVVVRGAEGVRASLVVVEEELRLDPVPGPQREGKIHRVGPKCASRPSTLTENPYNSLRDDPDYGSTL